MCLSIRCLSTFSWTDILEKVNLSVASITSNIVEYFNEPEWKFLATRNLVGHFKSANSDTPTLYVSTVQYPYNLL